MFPDPDANPELVEITRGEIVESRHRGAFAVIDANGKLAASAGEIDQPVYPRSAIKALQALPMVTTGVADHFGFDDAELALACASHNGEPAHVAAARSMLTKCGCEESDLECGVQWPTYPPASSALAAAGQTPTAIHNNCSGKHVAMLAFAKYLGVEPKGYTAPDHPVQQAIAETLSRLCETDIGNAPVARDGCSVPTWAVPLSALALGFAKFGSGSGLLEKEPTAAGRLIDAVHGHPFMVAGSERLCTKLMGAVPRAFVKTGAEGVYCGAIPHAGIGIALKCDDGATRAAEILISCLLSQFAGWADAEKTALAPFTEIAMVNRRGTEIGHIRASARFGEIAARY